MKEREVEDWDQGRGRSMRRSTPDMGAVFMLVLALMAPCDTGAKGSLQYHTSAAALSALLRPTLRSGLSSQHTSSGGATRMMGFVPSQGQLPGPWGSVRALGVMQRGVCIVRVPPTPHVPSLRRHASGPHVVCLTAKRKNAKAESSDNDSAPPPANNVVPAVSADVVAGKDVSGDEDLECEADSTRGIDTELSGEPVELRNADEASIEQDSDAEAEAVDVEAVDSLEMSGEAEGDEEDTEADGEGEDAEAEEKEGGAVDSYGLSDWSRLNSDDLTREVEQLYPRGEDNSQVSK